VSFRVALLLTQADAGEAAKVVEGLRQARDDIDNARARASAQRRELTRLQDLQEKVKL
jgi:hypothetical protein